MRKIVLTALLGAMSVGTAFAQKDNVGCGVGSMIFDGQSGVAPQVLAVTTNGTFGNQTFGISSGTLGCTQDGVVRDHRKVAMFTGSNLDKLASNMAAGQGEALETMASLMGIAEADKPAFYAATHEHFAAIFPSSDVTAEQVLAAVNDVLARDARLARYSA